MANDTHLTANQFAFVWRCNKRPGAISPTFQYRQRQIYLRFETGLFEGTDYRLHLFNAEHPGEPFDLSVFLVIGEVVSHSMVTVPNKHGNVIWKSTKFYLSKVVPDHLQKPFSFIIVIYGSAAPSEKKTEEKSVQTPDYLDTKFEIQSLSADLSKLLSDSSTKDVELVCRGRTFTAHQSLLSVRSDVFRAMLDSDMIEGKTGRVQIEDVEAGVFQHFLQYLYKGELEEPTLDIVIELYKLGDKYAVGALKKQCASFLVENLDEDNACCILGLADHHSDGDLKEIATAYIVEQKFPLQDRYDWCNLKIDHPQLAIEVVTRLCKLLDSCK